MLYVNNYQGAGYITRDVQLDQLEGGASRARFTLALNRPGAKAPFYIDCIAWGGLALSLTDRGRKGVGIFVSGELETSSFQDERGSWHKSTVLRIEKYSILQNPREDKEATLKKPSPPV